LIYQEIYYELDI